MTKTTISLIKPDVGGYLGHYAVHPALIETAESHLKLAKKFGAVIDFRLRAYGDNLQLIVSLRKLEQAKISYGVIQSIMH